MSLFYRGEAPIDVRLGDLDVLQLYLGDELIWDGTTPVLINAPTVRGGGHVPAAALSAGSTLAAETVHGAGLAPAPAVGGGAGVTAPAVLGVGEVPAPVLSLGMVVELLAALGGGTVPVPAVGETRIDAEPALGGGGMPSAVFSGGTVVTAVESTGGGDMPDPVLGTGVTVSAPAAAGGGDMPDPEFVAFTPAGMTKSGTFTLSSTTNVPVTGWTADAGSTVTSDQLVIATAGTGITIAASQQWALTTAFTRTVTMRLVRNGSEVLATGAAATIPANGSGTATVTATGVTVAAGDTIRLEALKDFGTGNPTATAGGSNRVTATKP
ncbi:hypothetical protein [Nocardia wallacei]|uniref:hypothetical protein n=1 Tax=Nocardia wallacei TaxID=480035 RepID=UPI00245378AB|nr:hypothetical protein [Nocardia wallacei]